MDILITYIDPLLDLTRYGLGHIMRDIIVEYDQLDKAEDREALIAMIKSLTTTPPTT